MTREIQKPHVVGIYQSRRWRQTTTIKSVASITSSIFRGYFEIFITSLCSILFVVSSRNFIQKISIESECQKIEPGHLWKGLKPTSSNGVSNKFDWCHLVVLACCVPTQPDGVTYGCQLPLRSLLLNHCASLIPRIVLYHNSMHDAVILLLVLCFSLTIWLVQIRQSIQTVGLITISNRL